MLKNEFNVYFIVIEFVWKHIGVKLKLGNIFPSQKSEIPLQGCYLIAEFDLKVKLMLKSELHVHFIRVEFFQKRIGVKFNKIFHSKKSEILLQGCHFVSKCNLKVKLMLKSELNIHLIAAKFL